MSKQIFLEGCDEMISKKIITRLEAEIMEAQDRYPTKSDVLAIMREEIPGLRLTTDGGDLIAHQFLEAMKQINE